MNVKKIAKFIEILGAELGHSSSDLLHLQCRTNYVQYYHFFHIHTVHLDIMSGGQNCITQPLVPSHL